MIKRGDRPSKTEAETSICLLRLYLRLLIKNQKTASGK